MQNKSKSNRIQVIVSVVIILVFLGWLIYSIYNPPVYEDPYVDDPSPGTSYSSYILNNALSQGLVEVEVTGNNLNLLDLTLISKSDSPLNLTIPLGTVFKSNSGSVQNMIAIIDSSSYLDPHESGKDMIGVVCVNMNQPQPGKETSFSIGTKTTSDDLLKLLQAEQFRNSSLRIRQFAVWTITDNPAKHDYTRLGWEGATEDSDYSEPFPEEIDSIKGIFVAAGIDTSKYAAFG
jgi:hypothetical protein